MGIELEGTLVDPLPLFLPQHALIHYLVHLDWKQRNPGTITGIELEEAW